MVHYDRWKLYIGTKQSLEKGPTEASLEPEGEQAEEDDEEIDYNVVYVRENVLSCDQYPADSRTSDSQQHALPTEISHPFRHLTRNCKPERYGNPIPH